MRNANNQNVFLNVKLLFLKKVLADVFFRLFCEIKLLLTYKNIYSI